MLETKAPSAAVAEPRDIKSFTLEDRYTAAEGRVIMSGIQALARLPLDQHRSDQARGLHTAGLITGYRGSPIGVLDFVLEGIPHLLEEHHIRFIPAVNEDLAATAIMGSQTANLLPDPEVRRRLRDLVRQGAGRRPQRRCVSSTPIWPALGATAACWRWPAMTPPCKSSTIPSHSEVALYDALMPILYPGSAQEILDMGLLGFALSRFSGLWVGFKIVTDVADEYSSVEVGAGRVSLVEPDFQLNGQPWRPKQNTALLSPYSLQQEKEIHDERLDAALAFARANRINEIAVPTADAWLGIIAAGKTWYDLRGALRDIGLSDDEALQRAGIRLLKLGMIFPLEREILREFAAGLDEILVIEEKRSFIETFCKEALYGSGHTPLIVGKKDETGTKLVKADNELDADEITLVLARRLRGRVDAPRLKSRLRDIQRPPDLGTIPIAARSPYFCSGCPHNRSTKVPEGSMAGAGIGCHTLAIMMDRNTAARHADGRRRRELGRRGGLHPISTTSFRISATALSLIAARSRCGRRSPPAPQ